MERFVVLPEILISPGHAVMAYTANLWRGDARGGSRVPFLDMDYNVPKTIDSSKDRAAEGTYNSRLL